MSDFVTPWTVARQLLCPLLFPGVCSNSYPLSQWCHLIISSSASPFFFCLHSSLTLGSFSNQLALHIRWPKYWSFSITPSTEYSGLISFRIDWFLSPCCPRDSQESSPAPRFKTINSSALSLPYGPTLTSVHDYWKNHSLDYTDLCWQSDVSAF